MVGTAIVAGNGVVLIEIPDGGLTGEVLTKVSNDDFDFDWAPGGGGGAPTNAEYVVMSLDATLTDERVLTAGTGLSLVDGGAGGLATLNIDSGAGGQVTLQDAYDADTTAPHITPLVTVGLEIAGELQIDGSLAQGNNVSLEMSDTYTQAAPFIGGGILSNGTVTYANATWIWALLQESKLYIANVAPAFAAFTLFNAIPAIRNGLNASLVQALVLNAGIAHQATGAVAVTTTQTVGLSFAPNTRALTAGGSMTKTAGDTGVNFAPTHGTVAASSIAHGTLRGLWMRNPAVALFQTGAGTETMTAYIGLEVDAIPFGGNVTKRALRSALTDATNTLMIENTGGANSDFGTGIVHLGDTTPLQFGGAAVNSQDVSLFWNAANSTLDLFFIANSDNIEFSNPVNGQILIDVGADEFTFNTTRGASFGDQTGVLGNAYFNFVQGAITPGAAGDFAGVLLTQSGNFTNGGLVRGRVSAWVINGLSYAASTGTVTESDTLTVGGMVTSSPGVTITDRQSLHVIAGRSRHDAAMQYEPINPATLSAGDNDDYAGLLTGTANNGMRHWARITGDAGGTSVITGIDATEAQDGDTFKITNVGTASFALGDQDVGSAASNRIISPTGANYTLAADQSAEVIRDTTTDRWRILYGSGA